MEVFIAATYLKGSKFELMLHEDFEDAVEPLRPMINRLRDEHKLFSDWYISDIDAECKLYVVYKKTKRAGVVRFKFEEIPQNEQEAIEFFSVLQAKAIGHAWDFAGERY